MTVVLRAGMFDLLFSSFCVEKNQEETILERAATSFGL